MNRSSQRVPISDSWEVLRGDPLRWLMGAGRPNVHWRILVELVGRPPSSPAVVRARGGANAAEPVASLLADLHPDGTWATNARPWKRYDGPWWRLVAAVQWGADPTDPRLHAAAERLLLTASGSGGFSFHDGGTEVAWLTARALQALAELGWCRHPRFQEALAWIEEGAARTSSGGWEAPQGGGSGTECLVTPAATLGALAACVDARRTSLESRAVDSLKRSLQAGSANLARLGHPCLGRTDLAEIMWALSRVDAKLGPSMIETLGLLQRMQDDGARWHRRIPVPKTLPNAVTFEVGAPSRWLTLKVMVAVMHYGVAAGLPRLYPEKP